MMIHWAAFTTEQPDLAAWAKERLLRPPAFLATVRSVVVEAASYEPAERYVFFEILVGEVRINGYGDVELPATRRWRATST